MTCISKTYTLTSPREDFFNGIDKIANKYGFTYEVFEEEKETRYRGTGNINPFTLVEETFKYEADVYTVFFTFGTFQVEGFEYLGCIKDAEMMGLITVHGNDEVEEDDRSLVDFITDMSEIPCHKCNRKTRRGIGHIFRNTDTKDLSVFGSTCAKNYFGIDFTRLLNVFARIDNLEDRCNSRQERGVNYIDWKWFSTIAFYNISKFAYISQAAANKSYDGGTVSTNWDSQTIMNEWNDTYKKFGVSHPCVTDDVKNTIKGIYENNDIEGMINHTFFNDIDTTTEFGHNLEITRKKMEMNGTTVRDLGFITYLVNQIFFNGGRKEFEKVVINDNPTEVQGDKLRNFTLKLTHKHGFESSYGWMNIYTLLNTDTNTRYKWFTGNDIVDDGEVWKDKEIEFTYASVKGIEESDKYGTSVLLTRCRVK